jgi:transposase
LHGSCNGLGQPVELVLTAGQESDIGQADALLAGHEPEAVVADKGYDKKELVARIAARGAEAVIPTQKNRKEQRAVDPHLYRERNVVERFWARAKQFRRVATRYEKLKQTFLGVVHLALGFIRLRRLKRTSIVNTA